MESEKIDKLLKFAEQKQRQQEYNKLYCKMRYEKLKENEEDYKKYLESIKIKNNERSKINFQKIKENPELYEQYRKKQNERRRKKE